MDSRNRLWWVMGGVALLLVVVLTGGLYWLRPVDSIARADFTLPRPGRGGEPFEYVASGSASTAQQAGDASDPKSTLTGLEPAVPADGVLESRPETSPAQRQSPVQQQPKPRVTVDTPAPASTAAPPEVRAIPTSEVRAAPAATARTPTSVRIGAPAATAVAPVTRRTVPMAKLAPSSPLHEFWVQVGSFASRTRADALGQRLSDQGIVSRVTTRASGADLFFRVRVGPYASREEAEKFLAWVQQVDGLDGSYISDVRNAGG